MPLNQKQLDALHDTARKNNATFPVMVDLNINGEHITGLLNDNGHFEETGNTPQERPVESNS